MSQLLALGLPVASRVPGAGGEDTARGLAFDFVRSLPAQPAVTGHIDGVITLVITSYSIHYTKLYDRTDMRLRRTHRR